MTRESDVLEYLRVKCDEIGALFRRLQYLGRKSAPDVMVAYRGAHLCEIKRPGETPRLDQQRELQRLRNQKCSVWVLSSYADVDYFIETIRYLRG